MTTSTSKFFINGIWTLKLNMNMSNRVNHVPTFFPRIAYFRKSFDIFVLSKKKMHNTSYIYVYLSVNNIITKFAFFSCFSFKFNMSMPTRLEWVFFFLPFLIHPLFVFIILFTIHGVCVCASGGIEYSHPYIVKWMSFHVSV